jgi:hypothetical protein
VNVLKLTNIENVIDAEIWELLRDNVADKDQVWVIFDLDGTLCDVSHRVGLALEKKWDEFNAACVEDSARFAEVLLARMFYRYAPHHRIALCTGRSEAFRTVTEEWLVLHGVPYDLLFMRTEGDHRPDTVVKCEQMFQVVMKGPILFVVEDRQKVVDMWRANGLTCFQNQEGAY